MGVKNNLTATIHIIFEAFFNLKIITKMKRVKAAMLALSIMLGISVSAQQVNTPKAVKQHEIGLSAPVTSLKNTSFIYRVGKPKAMWRLGLINVLNANKNTTYESTLSDNKNLNIGIRIGKEFRKSATEKFELRWGGDLTVSYASSQSSREDLKSRSQNFRSGINAVLGFNYLINKHLIIGAELLPSVNYEFTRTTRQDDSDGNSISESKGFITRLSNQSVLLSLAYRL